MDFHALQHKLFEIDPSDPAEDKKKLMAQAQGGAASDVPATKNYIEESVQVPEGSLPLGLDSLSDFAALAGVKVTEGQKMGSAGQAKGKDPMPSANKPTKGPEQKHPLRNKLVGEDQMQIGSDLLDVAITAGEFQTYFGRAWKEKNYETMRVLLDDLQKEITRAYKIIDGMQSKDVPTIGKVESKHNTNISSIKEELYKRLNTR